MKTIGLLGGMSWESTAGYYRQINEGVKARLGGLHSGKIVLNSVDFAEMEALQHRGEWPRIGELLADAARSVEAGGADFLLICTNTMHKVAEEVATAIDIPLLHIADATAETILRKGVKKVGLLGTRFTMEQSFYSGRLSEHYGIEVVTPSQIERERVHNIIYQELCRGEINAESREIYLHIIDKPVSEGGGGGDSRLY